MTTALVLGGGGPVGVAWEVGLLAGLAEAGVDLSDADRIVGTSAGSIVGARLALGERPDALGTASTERLGAAGSEVPAVDPEALLAIGMGLFEAMSGARPGAEVVADLGKLSTTAETIDEDRFVAMTAAGVLGAEWPDRDYRCTAFDVEGGELVAWSASSGVPLDRAVASSCSVPGIFPPVTIDGRRYMDGGLLSGTNAHLVTGADTVVVVSVMSRAIPAAEAHMRVGLDREVDDLRASGSTVEVLEFDDASAAAAGGDLMSFTSSAAVAAVAVEQGRREAGRIGAVWG